MLFWIILWFGIAIVIGAIANGKGHSGFGWFIYGLLLWPIALIHVLGVKPNQPVLEREALASGNAKKCPHCGEMVRPEATVCRFCQRELPLMTALPATSAAQGKTMGEGTAFMIIVGIVVAVVIVVSYIS